MWITPGLAVMCFAGASVQPPDLETVLSRASEYVREYERSFGMVIAREEYVQRIPVAGSASLPAAPGLAGALRSSFRLESQERRLLSDYMMVRLPSEGDQWVGFRAIVEVDGRAVGDRLERLQAIDSVEEAVERWRKLSAESARYNIGNVSRNTNVPTFALLVLHAEYMDGFTFERIDRDRVEDVDAWVIAFEEHATPALITNARGEDVPIRGRLWVDPADGRLVRTEVRTGGENSELRSEITVRYRPNAELGLWVPYDMREDYKIGDGQIEAIAKYSDFQQYEVSVDTSISK